MSTPDPQQSEQSVPIAEVIDDSAVLEQKLQELETKLNQQIADLQADNYDGFLELGVTIAPLLQQVTSSTAHLTHLCFESIKTIHALHHKLGLELSARSDEMAEKMRKVKSGKNMAKAYNMGV